MTSWQFKRPHLGLLCGLPLLFAACGGQDGRLEPTAACEGEACGDSTAEVTQALEGWGEPIWRDEFEGSGLKPWWYQMPLPYSAGNSESQWYRPENLEVSYGRLRIYTRMEDFTGPTYQAPYLAMTSPDGVNRAAPRDHLPAGTRFFTSGMINTRQGAPATYFPLYARFSLRARLPHGQGLLPAFWLRRNGGANKGEVDIMESFGNYRPGRGKFSLHFPDTLGVNTLQKFVDFEPAAPGTGGWHIWAVEITPTGDPLTGPIRFRATMDGTEYANYVLTDPATLAMLREVPTDQTWDIALNTAVGGKWVGEPDQQLGYLPMVHRCSRTQKVPPAAGCDTTDLFFAELPALFEIDYVRVYAYQE